MPNFIKGHEVFSAVTYGSLGLRPVGPTPRREPKEKTLCPCIEKPFIMP